MFRPIRRKKKEMDIDAAKELLQCSRRGVLAVNGDDGQQSIPWHGRYGS